MADVIAAVVDCSQAQMTDSAKNSKATDRSPVVQVPRKLLPKYSALSWAEVEAAAARGDDGLGLWFIAGMDRAPKNVAWLRDGARTVTLRGRPCLYSQGWDATN